MGRATIPAAAFLCSTASITRAKPKNGLTTIAIEAVIARTHARLDRKTNQAPKTIAAGSSVPSKNNGSDIVAHNPNKHPDGSYTNRTKWKAVTQPLQTRPA